jgi:hypothetical protein
VVNQFVENNKEKASRQTHTQETTKLTKEKSTGKAQMETCIVPPREKGRKESSEAESFKQMNIKYITHLKMAM